MNDQIEMIWRCKACGTQNGGLSKKCGERVYRNGEFLTRTSEGCGKALENEEWFFPKDISSRAKITDETHLDYARRGPDWYCGYCGSSQRRGDGACASCGGDPGFSKKDRGARSRRNESPSTSRTQTAGPFRRPSAPPDFRSSFHKKAWAIVGIVGAVIVGLLVFLLWPRKVDATVTSVRWVSTVEVARYQVVHNSGWDTPVDAFDIHDEGRRIHHYNRVQTGSRQKCQTIPKTCTTTPRLGTSNKNGTASYSGGHRVCSGGGQTCKSTPIYRKDPVYRIWYSWNEWVWRHNRTVKRSGRDLKPLSPTKESVALNIGCHGKERERQKTTWSYQTTFTDPEGESYKHEPETLKEFQSLRLGMKRRLRVTAGSVEVLPLNQK